MRTHQRIRMNVAVAFLISFLGIGLFIPDTTNARLKNSAEQPQVSMLQQGLQKSTQLNLPGSMLSWIGQGNLTTYTISNTGQNGYFEPPPGWSGYNDEFPFGYTSGNGRTGEFPRGTAQYYVWAAGVWIGAKAQGWDKPRVATAAYYSDQSVLSRLWQSNEIFNSSNAPESNLEGALMFKQKNQEPQDYQTNWAYFVPKSGDMILDYNQYTHSQGDTVYRLDYTDINQRRRHYFQTADISVDTNLIYLRPNRTFKDTTGLPEPEIKRLVYGDIVSDEDTYAMFGDMVPEDDAVTMFTFGYDEKPVGISVVQRTYSWGIDDWIYLDYKITNMNDFPLDSVYIGYFMDNDVGPNAEDDLIGFDENLNLGYSYDSDFQEEGWQTGAGYIGSVFVRTPRDANTGEEIGLTGFQTWIRTDLGHSEPFAGDPDDLGRDDLKYKELEFTRFEEYKEPTDVRQLISSGPYLHLEPGQTITATIAIVGGASLADLKENTKEAISKYQSGYISAEPPPSPTLTAQPANKTVFLSWNDSPEQARDPFTGEKDHAGYRVYKSLTGLEGDWTKLAEYDVNDDSSKNEVTMKYKRGGAKLDAKFLGFGPVNDPELALDKFTGDEYTIEFYYDPYDQVDWTKTNNQTIDTTWVRTQTNSDGTLDTLGHFPRKIAVYDKTQNRYLQYNKNATPGTDETGWNMMRQEVDGGGGAALYVTGTDSVYVNRAILGNLGNDLPYYRCRYVNGKPYGYILYFDGMYFMIQNGVREPNEPIGQTYSPGDKDMFLIQGYLKDALGNQSGLRYSYEDGDLINGKTYYYSVTSYDRGDPAQGIPSLESSKYQNLVAVAPQPVALQYDGEVDINDVNHSQGSSTSGIDVVIRDPLKITGDEYEVRFQSKSATFSAEYYKPVNDDTTLFPSVTFNGDSVETSVTYVNPYVGYDFSQKQTTHLRIPQQYFQARYTGDVNIPQSGDYDFAVDYANGGVRLEIDGSEVLNSYSKAGTGHFHYKTGQADTTLSLEADQHRFSLEYIAKTDPSINFRYGLSGSALTNVLPKADPADSLANSWMLINVSKSDTILKYWNVFNSYDLDQNAKFTSDDAPEGFYTRINKKGLVIGQVEWRSSSNRTNTFKFEPLTEQMEPYEYRITFADPNDLSTWSPSGWMEYMRYRGVSTFEQYVPWTVENMTLGIRARSWLKSGLSSGQLGWFDSTGVERYNDQLLQVLKEDTRADSTVDQGAFGFKITTIDTVLRQVVYLEPPGVGDTVYVRPTIPLSIGDLFDFTTKGLLAKAQTVDLNRIRVVPNPYYIRAAWDENQYNQWIEFRHLPSNCTIRIFTVAGTLVRTIHKEPGAPGSSTEYSGTAKWDLRNSRGVKAASGLYIYQVESKFGEKVGKFAIVMGP